MKSIQRGVAVMALLSAAAAVQAQTMMTEMTFGTPATNGSSAFVSMDLYPTLGTGLLYMRGTGARVTEILGLPTNIGRRWDERIRQGYLHVDAYTNVNDPRNQVGTSTSDRMMYYLNQSTGSDIPGTFYMVFRPTSSWTTGHRRTLTGTGGTGWTYMRLWVPQNSSTLTFDYVRVNATAAKSQITVTPTWSSSTWYFVAISWQSGQEPLLYLREMSAQGPEASPVATLGTLTTASGFQSTVPSGSNNMPFVRPLAIGAYYYDPGGNAGTVDGAAAHIAYVRIDRGLSTYAQIEAVFNALGAPDDCTLISLR